MSNVPLDLSPVTGGTLAWQESQRAMARSLELPVRHVGSAVVVGVVVTWRAANFKFREKEVALWVVVLARERPIGLACQPALLTTPLECPQGNPLT